MIDGLLRCYVLSYFVYLEAPHRVAWLRDWPFFLRDCVKTILFLRDCVNRLACVMRENVEKCAWLREIIQNHAWFRERHVFRPILAFLRENLNFSLVAWLRENGKKSAWLRDWGSPLFVSPLKNWATLTLKTLKRLLKNFLKWLKIIENSKSPQRHV